MHVEHFMTPDPVACDTSDSVEDAARLMREKRVGFLVVLERGRVVGILTDRQIATDCVGVGLTPSLTAVGEVMTPNPATVTLEDTLFTVVSTLRGAGVVRRVPVVNDAHELVGVVSLSDIAVIARDLVDAVLLEDAHHALSEVRVPSGGKRVQKEIRGPRVEERTRAQFKPVVRSAVPAAPSRGI